jgi:hypothetical protein
MRTVVNIDSDEYRAALKKKDDEKKRLEKNAKARARRAEKKKKQGIFLLNLYVYESNINFNVCFF